METTLSRVFLLDPARVKPFAGQPRKRFRGIAKLAESIRLAGQVTPIVVTACDDPAFDAELVDGERRLRACLEGGMKIKAVFEDAACAERYVRSVAANFCRQGHDAVEIMDAVLALKAAGKTAAEIAGIFGKTESWVSQYSSLAKLAPEVLDKLKVADDEHRQTKAERRRRGRMTFSLALLLVPLPHAHQVKTLRKIQAGRMSMAQARTFVHKRAASSGIRVGVKVSAYSKFKAVRSAVENCATVVERYLSMPGVEIQQLVRGATPDEKRKLEGMLEKLCEGLLMLSDALGK